MFSRTLSLATKRTVQAVSFSAKATGKVKFFDNKKGFGFIVPDDGSTEVFVHQTSIFKEGFRSLREGEPVEYELSTGPNGKINALNVTGPNGAPVEGSPPPQFSDRPRQDRGFSRGPRQPKDE